MADPLDINLPVVDEAGKASAYFEDEWYKLTQLAPGIPAIDMNLQLFNNGLMSAYFEDIWDFASAALGKPTIDKNVILIEGNFATKEFEDYWEILIS